MFRGGGAATPPCPNCTIPGYLMTIAAAEDWLVAVCQDAAGSSVTVTHAPHTWDGEYTKKLLGNLPAVVISWEGGSAQGSTSLTLDATWTVYVVTGWQGGTQETRRRAATTGAYALLTVLATRLHNSSMAEVQYTATGSRVPNVPDIDELDGFGLLRVVDIANESDGELGYAGLAVYAIELQQNMPLLGPDSEGFDDWLRTNVTFDIPEGKEFDPDTDEIGVDGDVTSRFDMPQ